jgi:hypothetical protein
MLSLSWCERETPITRSDKRRQVDSSFVPLRSQAFEFTGFAALAVRGIHKCSFGGDSHEFQRVEVITVDFNYLDMKNGPIVLPAELYLPFQRKIPSDGRASRSKIGCSVGIDSKGLVVRSRCLPDFHQTEIKVVPDLQSTNTNLSNPRCYFGCGWTPSRACVFYVCLTL